MKVPQKPVPRAETFEKYTAIRRGTTIDAGVVLIANGFLTSLRSPVKDIVPVSLTIDAEPGISYSSVSYPKPRPIKFPFRTDAVAVESGAWFGIEMKLHAAGDAPLGEHTMRGKLKYQAITNEGVSPVQEMDVSMPVKVVEHNAKVTKIRDYPFTHTSPFEIAGIVVLCIVLLPVAIPYLLVCVPLGRCMD